MASEPSTGEAPFRTEPFLLQLAAEGFSLPLSCSFRRPRSRLLLLADGRPVPVLLLLARKKFGTWTPEQEPCWKDGDFHNETLENVDLRPLRRFKLLPKPGQPPVRNKYDVPSGTREYMKRWHAAHPGRQKEYQKKYYAKRTAEDKKAAPVTPPKPPPDPKDVVRRIEALLHGE